MPKIDVSYQPENTRQCVTLTLTQDCNLRCSYCYEPNKTRDFYMSFETAQQAVIEHMKAENEFQGIQFDFFGGEPMLAFNIIRDLVDWFHSHEWPKAHLFFIATNGTLLTDEMKTWLVDNKECVKIGLSLDGNKIAHDINRSNSYDRVKNNLLFFREHWSDQPVKMTISAESIPYVADSIIELEEMEIPFFVNMPFENIWGTPEQKLATLEIYAGQLDRLVEYYTNHSELYPAQIVDAKLEFTTNEALSKMENDRDCARYCGAGHEMVVINVDGSQAPCHRFAPWVTGKSLPITPVNHQKNWGPEKCAKCRLIEICPSCAGYNWEENGASGTRTTYHCESFKLEVRASAKLQSLKLLQKSAEDLAKLSSDDMYWTKLRLDALLDIAENGI